MNHTPARITSAGRRLLTTESGDPLFQVLTGAVGSVVADANEARLVTIWNSHDLLLLALRHAKRQLGFANKHIDCADAIAEIDEALEAAGVAL